MRSTGYDTETPRGTFSDEIDPRPIEEALNRIRKGEITRETMKTFSQTIVDSALKTLERDSIAVEDYLFFRNDIKDEEERREIDEKFVVEREGLKYVLSLIVEDGIGLSHNFDPFRRVVEKIPENRG